METKKCSKCKTEYPKTKDFFFAKVVKQQNKHSVSTYYGFRSNCKDCYSKRTEERRVKKRCKDLNCEVSDYRSNWKRQYSKRRSLDYEAKEKLTSGQYNNYKVLYKKGVVESLSSYLIHIEKSKKERNERLIKIVLSNQKYFTKEDKRLALRMYAKNNMKRLTDSYISNVVMRTPVKDLTPELIETKRLIIKIKRELKSINN